jgi:O-antigen/teichoic acid export membrane protein
VSARPAGPARLTTGRRVAGNLTLSFAAQAWSGLLLIVTTPVLVHALHEVRYGVFVTVSLVLGYLTFLDLGLTPAVVRSIARHRGQGDRAGLERSLRTALTLFLALALAGGVLLAAGAGLLAGALHVPAALRPEAVFVFRLAAAGYALNVGLALFAAVPLGLQRVDLFAIRSLVLSTGTAAGQIAAVLLGGGLTAVAAVTVAVSAGSLAVFVVAARRLLPGVRFRPGFDGRAARELAGFASMRFVNQASGVVVFQLDRLLVGALAGLAQLTYYSVPLSVTQKFTVIQSTMSNGFFPAAAELHGMEDRERLDRLFLSATKLSFALVLPLAALVAGFASPVLRWWIGADFAAHAAPILAVLAAAYCVATVLGVPSLVADATGHPHWTASFAAASAVVNVGLAVLLVPRLGAIGAAWALLLNGAVQGSAFVLVVLRRVLGIPLSRFLGAAIVRPLLCGAAVLAYGLLLAPRIGGPAELLGALAGGAALYLALSVLLGVWDRREREVAREVAAAAAGRLVARLRPGPASGR